MTSLCAQSSLLEEICASRGMLKRYARKLGASPDEADELAQITIIKAWRAQETFRSSCSLKNWLRTILRNHYFREVVRAKSIAKRETLMIEQEAVESHESLLAMHQLIRCYRRLSPRLRAALNALAHYDSYEEIATHTGWPMGTVKSRLNRAREALCRARKEASL